MLMILLYLGNCNAVLASGRNIDPDLLNGANENLGKANYDSTLLNMLKPPKHILPADPVHEDESEKIDFTIKDKMIKIDV